MGARAFVVTRDTNDICVRRGAKATKGGNKNQKKIKI